MNLYEFEGKHIFEQFGIAIPRGQVVMRGQNYAAAFADLGVPAVVVKAQVLSGKRGKHNAIRFCNSAEAVTLACTELFAMDVRGQYVAAVRIEEEVDILEEHYLSITYDTATRQPLLVYSRHGGMDIEAVPENEIIKVPLAIGSEQLPQSLPAALPTAVAEKLWRLFRDSDARLVEINPLVKTKSGDWVAADAKVALDDDAFFRHEEWQEFEPRTMMGRPATDREIMARKIDAGEKYYQGTAGKYIELDGDIAVLFIGGGASIANMDALIAAQLKPANYTEYSGNPPREKVYELTKLVLSKPGLKGLWIVGVVSNFTNVKETFAGTIDALEEIKPSYPIVVRRDGPFGAEGRELMRQCADRNGLNMKLFGKETPMGETARVLADMLHNRTQI